MGRERSDNRTKTDPSSGGRNGSGDDRPSLSRRSYLAVAAAAVTGSVAGCVGGTDDPAQSSVQPLSMYGFGGDEVFRQEQMALTTESEPNGDRLSANPIEVGSQVTGRLGTDDVDWFSFEVADGTTVRAALDRQSETGVIALLLYNPDGDLVTTSVVAGPNPGSLTATVTDAGEHFLGVVDAANGSGAYEITTSTGQSDGGNRQSSNSDSSVSSSTGDSTTSEPVSTTPTTETGTTSTPTPTPTDDGQSGQTPFRGTVTSIPGTVQAEDFDEGGEGIAYHDADAVSHTTAARTEEGVDVERSQDDTDDLSVGYVEDGEWLEYTVDVTPGTYDVHARVSTAKSGLQLRLKLGEEVVGTVDVPDTGGWYDWETVTLEDVPLSGGTGQILRIEMVGDGANLNWIRFDRNQMPFGGSPHSIPGTVQAEDFDEGGEGIAYHDADAVSHTTAARTDEGVDVERSQDDTGDLSVGYVEDGEWLEYTVDVTPGTYDLQARVATDLSGRRLRVSLDGTSIGTLDVPNTGGWYDWETVTLADITVEADGHHVLRVEAIGNGSNLNWVRFAPTEPSETTTTTTTTTDDTEPTTTTTDGTEPTTTTTDGTEPTTTTTVTAEDDYGDQGYGQYGYGGISS